MAYTDPYDSYDGPAGFPNTDCSSTPLPAVSFAECPEGYVAHEGEIAKVYITHAVWNTETKVYEAYVLPADWTSSASYDVEGIITLTGFGDKPIAEAVTVVTPYNRPLTTNRNHTMNFEITDMSLDNYEFIRALQGTQQVVMWYQTIDGYIFGGTDGIIARIPSVGNVHARGENALLAGQIQFAWKNLFDPPAEEIDGATPLMAAKVKAPAALKSKAPKAPAEATA